MRRPAGINTPLHALLVAPPTAERNHLANALRSLGVRVDEANTLSDVMPSLSRVRPSVVLCDMHLSDGNALELLRPNTRKRTGPVIVFGPPGEVTSAVDAMKAGAEHYFAKPLQPVAVAACVRAVVERMQLPRTERGSDSSFPWRSAEMQQLEERVQRLREADCPVLILGETGTGKSLLARRIHDGSPRAEREFVDLNCAGLHRELVESELFGHERGAFTGAQAPKAGLFEMAEGGTIFFDELGDLDVAVQPKVLKVLEEKRFRRVGEVRERRADVRLLAATHRDLLAEVERGRFRADLFYRVSTVTLVVPPLRRHSEDILPFAEHLLQRLSPGAVLMGSAIERLLAHRWPGNLRELRNVLERAVLSSGNGQLTARDILFDGYSTSRQSNFPADTRRSLTPPPSSRTGRTLVQIEAEHIRRALDECGGRVELAAAALGVPRSTMYQKLKQYGIDPKASR